MAAPAGTYLVNAKGRLDSDQNVDSFSATECRIIVAGATEPIDYFRMGSVDANDVPLHPFAFTGIATLASAGTIELQCLADEGADGIGIRFGTITALKTS